jgi:hypothetical protein
LLKLAQCSVLCGISLEKSTIEVHGFDFAKLQNFLLDFDVHTICLHYCGKFILFIYFYSLIEFEIKNFVTKFFFASTLGLLALSLYTQR